MNGNEYVYSFITSMKQRVRKHVYFTVHRQTNMKIVETMLANTSVRDENAVIFCLFFLAMRVSSITLKISTCV